MTPAETTTTLRQFNEWRRGDYEPSEQPAPPDPREIGEAIDAAVEMIDRLEAAESDALEQARLNGVGSEREAALMVKLEAAEKDIALKERIIDSLGSTLNAVANERDALLARIEEMERQKPVAWMLNCQTLGGDTGWMLSWTQSGAGMCNRLSGEENERKLYALPGAQPAPSVPTESIGKMLAQAMEVAVANGANSVSMPDELVEVAAWLSGVQPNPANGQTRAVRDVIAERRRQIEAEGRTTQHDDANPAGVMSVAAACYAIGASNALVLAVGDTSTCPAPEVFPWEDAWWKPTTPRRDLVKAAALILAEIERLDRAAAQKTEGE